MYHPYFRGKQFELIAIREMAPLLARKGFVPIIEPVREALGGLKKTLQAVCDVNGSAILIVNPYHGDHQEDGTNILSLLETDFRKSSNIKVGILLRDDLAIEDFSEIYAAHRSKNPVLIHAGFASPKLLAESIKSDMSSLTNVFVENHTNVMYRRHFQDSSRVLIRDGFTRQRNADYPPKEVFSELHLTYPDSGAKGFGDFLIVGDVYSEGGGPAYAVAIHLTFIDRKNDDVMYIYHFVSERKDTPTDPAGKFSEALEKMIRTIDGNNSGVFETEAIKEFRNLHEKRHFPGLGYLKKLSMKHHIETLAIYLD